MNDDPLGKSLGLPPIEPNKTIQTLLVESNSDNATKDFEVARGNIHYMAEIAKEAILNLNEIASQSQHPRAYEVLAKLIDTSVNTNKSLLDLQDKIRSLNSADNNVVDNSKNVQNNLFVGSTADLQQFIKNMKKSDG
jgi:hypothetical protein